MPLRVLKACVIDQGVAVDLHRSLGSHKGDRLVRPAAAVERHVIVSRGDLAVDDLVVKAVRRAAEIMAAEGGIDAAHVILTIEKRGQQRARQRVRVHIRSAAVVGIRFTLQQQVRGQGVSIGIEHEAQAEDRKQSQERQHHNESDTAAGVDERDGSRARHDVLLLDRRLLSGGVRSRERTLGKMMFSATTIGWEMQTGGRKSWEK